MLGWAITLLLTFAPPEEERTPVEVDAPADADADVVEAPEPEPKSGELVLIPRAEGTFVIVDSEGRSEQTVAAGPRQPTRVSLSPGIYYLQDQSGTTVAVAVIVESRPMLWDGHELVSADVWTGHAPPVEPEPQPIPPPISQPQPRPKRNHKRWASPLASTLIPGTGQIINGQGGKAVGILFGTLGSVIGATMLYRLENDGRRSNAAEYSRLIGYGLFSTAAPMLWIYGIADAYRVAADETIEPRVDHRVRLSIQRTMTVGFRADARRPGFYDNWSGALMGQATRRLTVGVADLSFGPGGPGRVQFGQFGLRLDYRVYEHPRLWLDLGVGTAMQVASLRGPRPLDPEAALPRREVLFAAIPYGYFDIRCFILDGLSLDFTPRLSVPVTTRYFSAGRALPRFAPNLELGAGISVYF